MLAAFLHLTHRGEEFAQPSAVILTLNTETEEEDTLTYFSCMLMETRIYFN